MNQQLIATVLGAVICCVVPLAAFAAGVYYARYGFPVEIRFRGRRNEEDV